MKELFRICPATGLKIHRDAERLIKVNAVTAVVFFLVGVLAAIGLALTRWQAVHLLSATWYYRILTAHGLNMLIFFILFFEMAILYFASSVLLGARIPAFKLGWLSYALMLVGAVMTDVTVFAGKADVLFTSYVPLRAHPAFYLGIILFAVGALIVTGMFFATLVVAKAEGAYKGSVPLVTYGALTAAVISVITLLHGAAIYIPTFFWSLGMMDVDPQIYRMVWWGLGHSSQQINVAAHVSVWYLLAAFSVGGVVLNQKISRGAFFLYVLFISMASAHHLLVDPGFSPSWKIWNTSYAMYLAVLASMVHGFTVPAGVEMGQRLRGFVKGRFEWLVKAPWGDPGFSAMWLSLIIFGFLGGITGVTLGTEQINIMAHNTLRIPGHFHVTVVGGTALAFMGLTYYLLPVVFQKRVAFWPLARLQPYVFAGGITLMSMSMTFSGIFGVPRRHYDITFQKARFAVEYPAIVDLFLAGIGIGGMIAALGGLIYIGIAVVSVFFGKTIKDEEFGPDLRGVPQGISNPPRAISDYSQEEKYEAHETGTPGTMVLVWIFLGAFVLYYFTNWKILSAVWKIG